MNKTITINGDLLSRLVAAAIGYQEATIREFQEWKEDPENMPGEYRQQQDYSEELGEAIDSATQLLIDAEATAP